MCCQSKIDNTKYYVICFEIIDPFITKIRTDCSKVPD